MLKNRLEQTLDSREVAEMVGKDHHKLLRDIRLYISQLGESKIGYSEFFREPSYISEQNKKMPCYQVTKKGCEFIAHKLTGIKGTEFTARYINRFHEMEDELKSEPVRRKRVTRSHPVQTAKEPARIEQHPAFTPSECVLAYNRGFILGVFRAEIDKGNISIRQIYSMLSPMAQSIVADQLLGLGGLNG